MESIIELNMDEFNEFLEKKPFTGKNNSQSFVLKQLHKRFGFEPITIVETGCIRSSSELNKIGDGWSTFSWCHWAKKTKSMIYCVDKNRVHLNLAKNLMGLNPHINYILSDSVDFLHNLPIKFTINLLFLDSLDYIGTDDCKKMSSQHQLNEIKSCEKNLNEESLILIDDVFNKNFEGKGFFSIPYLLNKNWKILNYQDNQILLSK